VTCPVPAILLAAVDSATLWSAVAASLTAGGAGTLLVKYLYARFASREGRLERKEVREAALEQKTVDRLWDLVKEQQGVLAQHQAQILTLQKQVEEIRKEKHDALTKLAAAVGERDVLKGDLARSKKAAEYWFGLYRRAVDALGPERAKELGLVFPAAKSPVA